MDSEVIGSDRVNRAQLQQPVALSSPSKPDLPPISAMFLSKFDVHTGYEMKWFRSLNASIYNSKNLEFKSLPSGLHSVSSDIVCFVQEKSIEDESTKFSTKEFLYGLCVFKQNLDSQTLDSNGNINRENVKMYSLGVLVDPVHLNEAGNTSSIWKPKIYSSCWGYRNDLYHLLTEFMKSAHVEEEDIFCTNFEQYYEIHRFKGPNDPTTKFKDIMKSVNLNRRKSIQTLLTEEMNNNPNESNGSITENGTSAATSIFEPAIPKCDCLLDSSTIDDDHMMNSLLPLLEDVGPLIFKIWKLSLLRKKIILYAPHQPLNTPTEPERDSTPNSLKFKQSSISDFSKFIYCISLISSVPKEIRHSLIKSGVLNLEALEFNKPIYNVCVNDITALKDIKSGFIASTTDQIILEKKNLYDYSLRISPFSLVKKIESCNADNVDVDELLPRILKAGGHSEKPQLATSRDFKRFKILYLNFFSENGSENSIEMLNMKEVDEREIDLPQYVQQITEPASIRELFWNSFSWWATAGGSDSKNDEYELEYELFDDLSKDDIEKLITLVGYFQKLTIKLFNMLIEIVQNNESDHLNEQNLEADLEEDYSGVERSEELENDPLLQDEHAHTVTSKTIWIEPQDLHEMGLDPYSSSDCDFLVELVNVWWGKEAKIGGYFGNPCCI